MAPLGTSRHLSSFLDSLAFLVLDSDSVSKRNKLSDLSLSRPLFYLSISCSPPSVKLVSSYLSFFSSQFPVLVEHWDSEATLSANFAVGCH